ncbi:MAG: sigma-54-dependent Fis family transcriptional regulator [Candidatus Hydrogenedentota bacterium]|nr:MAG: sigma-54-dependent Fis family transcriptional regulator [Candidatus Hydrogenedentota bacterium]
MPEVSGTILVVDDEESVRKLVARALQGRDLLFAGTAEEAREKYPRADVVLLDLKLGDASGMDLLEEWSAEEPRKPVIIMTAMASISSAVEAMKKGARDYLQKPFPSLDELRLAVDRAVAERRLELENIRLRELLVEQDRFEEMIGASPAMRRIYEMVDRVAATNATILITGESGTGKELVARAIHRRSDRRKKPFVEINCAAIPHELLESELFGHERGAFTGAVRRKQGLLERANGGTVFLDEIGEMPLDLQAKLLRVMDSRGFLRVGGTDLITVNLRFIAATNRNLETAVARKRFREDLFYRLAVITIDLPPLRKRKGDIPLLLAEFLPGVEIEPEALELLKRYPWPGNIRELKNIAERIKILDRTTVGPDDLPQAIRGESREKAGLGDAGYAEEKDLPARLREFEKGILEEALARERGSRARAARRLGITRQSLQYKLEKYGLLEERKESDRKD